MLVCYLLDHPLSEDRRPKGFKGRFGKLFDNLNLLMATAIHPRFKLGAVARINKQLFPAVKDRLIVEALQSSSAESDANLEKPNENEEDDFFKVCSYFRVVNSA